MMGITLIVMKVDQEMKDLVDLECQTIGLTQFNRGVKP
jgi:hypothetical protein